jgi:hypothetical protein
VLNPLNAELNPICNFVALLGAYPILHVSRIRVKACCLLASVLNFGCIFPIWLEQGDPYNDIMDGSLNLMLKSWWKQWVL